jgi:ribonuclease R
MEFSIATLLANFTDDKSVAPKVLEKKLGCQDEDSLRKLQIVLDALEKIGILVKERGRYRRVYEEGVVEAKLRCSSKGFCFAIQDAEEAEDIYIRESHLSNAWNGDRVLVKVLKEGSRRRSPEGEVRLILERANPSVLARVKQTEVGYRAIPLDDRLLFELKLQANGNILDGAIDHLVHVEVLRYPLGQNLPLGKVARILGSDAEAAADTDIVCCKHDLPRSFPTAVNEAAAALPKELRRTDIKNRRDLRDLLTISFYSQSSLKHLSVAESQETEIESNATTTSLAIENALTLEKTPAGNWRLGIHIADVAHYVAADSVLDREARKRGTAIYLGDIELPLLPPAVVDSCSLIAGIERLAITVFLEIDSTTGQIIEFEIQPTIICVNEQLSYEEIQTAVTGVGETSHHSPQVLKMLENLLALSPIVREQRLARGSFEIHQVQAVESPYSDEGRLGAIAVSSLLPVRSLLTELIVLANQAVSDHLQALLLPGIYCTQSAPDPLEIQDLIRLAANLGLPFQLESEEEVHPQDYQRFSQLIADSSAAGVLNYLLKSTLKTVGYSTVPSFHFGLAAESGYTRFLCPLRRYADLLVQRILHLLFDKGRDRRTTRTKESVNLFHSSSHGKINWNVLPPDIHEELESTLTAIITYLNDREKLAQDAETDLEGLQKAELMKERTGEVFQGLITGVQSYGFFVEIEGLLVEGLVHVSSLKDDWYEYRSRHCCLVGRKNRTAYRLGDRVEVQVKSVDYYRQQIDLVTVSGGSEASNEDIEGDGE